MQSLAGAAPVSSTARPTFRGFNISQYDLPGSKTSCTAIAVVAARKYLQADGQINSCMLTHDQVMEILAQGVVWHSRWLVAGEGSRVPSGVKLDQNSSVDEPPADVTYSMATADEVCALPGVPMEVTDTCYAGYLTAGCSFGKTLEQSIREIFSKGRYNQGPQAFVLTTKGYSTMIGRRGGAAVVFDSHRRSPKDGLAVRKTQQGGAVVVSCPNADVLISYLKTLYASRNGTAMYTLQEVALDKDSLSQASTPSSPELSSLRESLMSKTQQLRDTFERTIRWPLFGSDSSPASPDVSRRIGAAVRIAV
eukprot:comp23512_c0_seq1/m.39472 comp23512_c0_seq1/g.39472  ORF comp23512_c0_seq1/g.39472 comp23512_c0_seq1/m.39472 type:complete len:308 (-) comp23512_c0_seq1:435-1358(-)